MIEDSTINGSNPFGTQNGRGLFTKKSLLTGVPVTVEVNKPDGEQFSFETTHTFSDDQINWFISGSALNVIRAQTSTSG